MEGPPSNAKAFPPAVEVSGGLARVGGIERRALSRALSRVSEASVQEALDGLSGVCESLSRRIGVTGPPGAGKSVLISCLAQTRLASARSIGVLAIDPSSPLSGGSILGDRVRLEEAHDHRRLFFRSMPSRASHDGLTDNVADLLTTMEKHGLEEIIVETVGVGQVEYTIRAVVDTVVLVVVPGAGDEVQTMKAGILEIADVFVVNKSDLPGARKMQSDLAAMVALRPHTSDSWRPPVLLASAENGDLGGLSEQIDAHAAWQARRVGVSSGPRSRMRHHVGSLLSRRVAEVLDGLSDAELDREIAQVYRIVRDAL